MAELTIRLRVDPATGKKNVVIKLHSDADALPLEHEQEHRAIVDQLIAGGALKQAELGKIIVERLPEGEGLEVEGEQQGQAEPVPQRRG
ncbi:MAG: hypothetical protein R3F59_02110 [Myxococcota bacterium]